MITRAIFTRVLRPHSSSYRRTIQTISLRRPRTSPSLIRSASHAPMPAQRWNSSISLADQKIEEITELYAAAQDEFEMASEETEQMTIYAQGDRAAAREELTKVQAAYKAVIEGPDQNLAQEVQRRIGQRIRELEQGVAALEERAMQQD